MTSVSLVDADPDLVAGIPDADLDLARRILTGPLYDVPAGRWRPELLRAHDNDAIGMLVVRGAIVRQLDMAERHCTQILGPGDVFSEARTDGLLRCPVTWAALEPSAVFVLDARFTLAGQRWPSLGVNLQRRLLDQGDRAALHAAISQLPRVDRRLLALFWQLAERWGRVTAAGVEVPLHLTHEALGRLVGAQRPTVTLALGVLADAGVVVRADDGTWMLHPDSRNTLFPSGDGLPSATRADVEIAASG